jgi:hypothetical protein
VVVHQEDAQSTLHSGAARAVRVARHRFAHHRSIISRSRSAS